MFDHVGSRTRKLAALSQFYKAALAPLGLTNAIEYEGGLGLGDAEGAKLVDRGGRRYLRRASRGERAELRRRRRGFHGRLSASRRDARSEHSRQHAVGRPVAVHEGLDIDDHLLAHLVATLVGRRAHVRQQRHLA